MVICLERGADCLRMVLLTPLPHQNPTISCLIKIQNGFNFVVPACPGCPGKEAVDCMGIVSVNGSRYY